jgi:hypothetical protein
MGAGEFNMGAGLAGLDPPADPSERTGLRKATKSRLYDYKLRDYTIDSEGRANEENSLDTWVKLQLTIAKNSIQSDPEHGNPISEITHLGRETASQVENKVVALMQPKVISKELQIKRIDVRTSGNRIGLTFDYYDVELGLDRQAAV